MLHVINSLSGSGGAEHGLVREVTRFDDSVEQLVATLYQPGELASRLKASGIDTLNMGLDSSRSGWNWPLAARRVGSLIREYKPEVIQSSLASGNLVAQLAAKPNAIPVLSTFTLSGDPSLMKQYQPGAASWKARLIRRVERRAARRDHVWFRALTFDAMSTNCAAAGIDESRAVVIPRGVPIPNPASPPVQRAELGLPTEVPVVLNVGRQTAQKGHVQLVEAFARLLKTRAAHLVILGREGDGSDSLRRAIAQAGVGEHVTVISYTPRTYDFYRCADVMAFPSLMEGLGTAVLEAMACGLPVVAYDIPPIRELAGDSEYATLVPTGDVSAMARLTLEVLENSAAAATKAEKARALVTSEYSLDAVSTRLQARLSELAALGGGRASR